MTALANTHPIDRVVIHPVGELDYFTARRLLETISDHLSEQTTRIVLDLTSLSFCDSAGVGLAQSVRSWAHDHGLAFELKRADSPAGRVFDLLAV